MKRMIAEIRLAFIDDRLTHAGKVNRKDIEKAFAVTMLTASYDIRDFLKIYPGRMAYNAFQKTYRPVTNKPVFSEAKRLAVRQLVNTFRAK